VDRAEEGEVHGLVVDVQRARPDAQVRSGCTLERRCELRQHDLKLRVVGHVERMIDRQEIYNRLGQA